MRSLQFEIWQECNSLCKYCYLGTDNRLTPIHMKINSLKSIYEKISNPVLYQGDNPVEILSYLGGEFFQGQLNSPEVRELFFKLMEKTADLFNSGVIKQVWIYATMTIGDQKDLYDTLDLFDHNKDGFWLLTSYDTIGRFHTPKMLDTWEYHMQNIHKKYPNIKFNTTTIITQDLINKYMDGEFSFREFVEEHHTAMFYKQPGCGNITKKEMNERLGGLFFPKRHDMLKFLNKFYEDMGPDYYNRLFNISYRADDLYRNYNNEEKIMQLQHRVKNSKIEEVLENGDKVPLLPCGHLEHYQAYSDSDECVLCDKRKILIMMEGNSNSLPHD